MLKREPSILIDHGLMNGIDAVGDEYWIIIVSSECSGQVLADAFSGWNQMDYINQKVHQNIFTDKQTTYLYASKILVNLPRRLEMPFGK